MYMNEIQDVKAAFLDVFDFHVCITGHVKLKNTTYILRNMFKSVWEAR